MKKVRPLRIMLVVLVLVIVFFLLQTLMLGKVKRRYYTKVHPKLDISGFDDFFYISSINELKAYNFESEESRTISKLGEYNAHVFSGKFKRALLSKDEISHTIVELRDFSDQVLVTDSILKHDIIITSSAITGEMSFFYSYTDSEGSYSEIVKDTITLSIENYTFCSSHNGDYFAINHSGKLTILDLLNNKINPTDIKLKKNQYISVCFDNENNLHYLAKNNGKDDKVFDTNGKKIMTVNYDNSTLTHFSDNLAVLKTGAVFEPTGISFNYSEFTLLDNQKVYTIYELRSDFEPYDIINDRLIYYRTNSDEKLLFFDDQGRKYTSKITDFK